MVKHKMFEHLGRALRWLRENSRRKQYQVADAAGITTAMLSAYETGKQKPSLETLEKVLGALGCDLEDLHRALAVFAASGVPADPRPRSSVDPPTAASPPVSASASTATGARPDPGATESSGSFDVRAALGLDRDLPPEEEAAVTELVEGFHKLVRYLLLSRKD